MTARTNTPGAGLCGCERPAFKHDKGCLWGLDRKRRTKGGAAARVTLLEGVISQLLAQLAAPCPQCGHQPAPGQVNPDG